MRPLYFLRIGLILVVLPFAYGETGRGTVLVLLLLLAGDAIEDLRRAPGGEEGRDLLEERGLEGDLEEDEA